MKILLINKFYYPRGGADIASMQLDKLLSSKGHQVAFFSCTHQYNIHSDWQGYFPSKVNFNGSFFSKVKFLIRSVYGRETENSFRILLDDFVPDIVHIHSVHSYLSPIVAKVAYEKGIPVVWTLHDYKLICPTYLCVRKDRPCEICFENKLYVVKYKCMKNSYLASIAAYLEAKVWNRNKIEKYVSSFICPSNFIKTKMVQGGFDSNKQFVICNFIPSLTYNKISKREDYYCYVGRISPEKGIETLLKAAENMPYTLKIAGDGPLFDKLKCNYKSDKIEFLGRLNSDEVIELLAKAKFSVIPSECYENNPLSVIESLSVGTPVLGASIGGIPELISNNHLGRVFQTRNICDLQEKIEGMYRYNFDSKYIIEYANKLFNSDTFYEKVMSVYEKLLNKN